MVKQEVEPKQTVIPNQKLPTGDGKTFVNSDDLLADLDQTFKGVLGEDFSKATGIGDYPTAVTDLAKLIGSELGVDVEIDEFSPRGKLIKFIETLFTTTKLSLRDDIGGRAFAQDVENLERDFRPPSVAKDYFDKDFLGRLIGHKGRIQFGLKIANEIIDNPMKYSKEDVAAAKGRKLIFDKLLVMYQPVIDSYEQRFVPKKKERKIINLDR